MEYIPLAIPDVVLIKPKVFGDERGFFMETFRQSEFEQHCGYYQFVQDNHSKSGHGVLRGLHYQLKRPQGKLVRVTRGEVFDVAVDMRKSSPTYGKWVGQLLNDTNKHQLWVPPGFAHGFLVTGPEAEFVYKCTDYYDPYDESGVNCSDPDLSVCWPDVGDSPTVSAKDAQAPFLQQARAFD